ncbi:hypothetical protein [Arthrobacter sp. CAN_A1]|uniref:hypothetical protein n=1 Tax=Arthrobacter sp. CAN_A1 TaxID=2787717 RepID=UPI0018C99CFF
MGIFRNDRRSQPASDSQSCWKVGFGALLSIATVFTLNGCSGQSANPLSRGSLDNQGERAEVVMADMEAKDWTSALIVCPYQPADLVEQKLGIEHPLDTRSDVITRIVFASEERIEEVITIGTYEDANLCTIETPVLQPDSTLSLQLSDAWELTAAT